MGCIRVTRLLALAIAVSLTLGAAAQDAEAGICKSPKAETKKECVDSKDVENGSLDASQHLKDEARGKFKGKVTSQFAGLWIPALPVVNLKLPRPGVAIATASVDIFVGRKGSLSCSIMGVQDGSNFMPKRFVASVNPEKFIFTASMSATTSFEVKKGDLRVRLSCQPLSGLGGILISHTLSAQYYPKDDPAGSRN